MKQLLRIYIKDFSINALYLFAVVWALGIIINFITANLSDLPSILYTLFIFFFSILFIYSYPLSKCLNWVLYTPIPRKEIICFNVIFQVYKIIFVTMLFTSLILSTLILFPEKNPILEKINRTEKLATQIANHSRPAGELVKGDPDLSQKVIQSLKSSNVLFGLILVLLSMLSFVFSLSPQLLIQNKNAPLAKLKYWLSKLKSNKKYLIIALPIGWILKILYPYWSSSLFVVSFAITFVIFFSIYSYVYRLLFPIKILRRTIYSALVSFVLVLSFAFSYSTSRLNSDDLNLSYQVDEITFQGKFYSQLNEKMLREFLESPINGEAITSLMDIFGFHDDQSNNPPFAPSYPHFRHSLVGLDFHRIMDSKKETSALMTALGLFNLKKLEFEQINFFVEKWNEVRNKEKFPKSSHYLAKRIMDFSFTKENIRSFLQSDNTTKQYLGLELVLKFSHEDMQNEILANVMDFDNNNLILASKILSKFQCRPLSSVEIIKLHQQGRRLPAMVDSEQCQK